MLIFAHGVQQKNREIRFQRHGVCVLRTDILRLETLSFALKMKRKLINIVWLQHDLVFYMAAAGAAPLASKRNFLIPGNRDDLFVHKTSYGKTAGEDQHCIFLNGNHCSIYARRPRACRMYPFTVDAGRRGKDFEYFLCTDYPGHFSKGRIRVSDWFYENFPKDARRFVKADCAAIRQYGKLLRQMTPAQVEHSLFQLLFYRYWNYDLSKPFQEQFEHNQRQLLAFLQEQLTQNGGSI